MTNPLLSRGRFHYVLFLFLLFVPTSFAASIPITITSPRGLQKRSLDPTVFKWVAPAAGIAVDRYELVLYEYIQAGAPPKILSRKTVKNDLTFSNELSDALPSGAYAWKVEAKDKDGTIIGGGQVRFQIVADIYRRPGSFEILAGVELDDFAYTSTTAGLTGQVPSSLFGYLLSIDYRKDEKWSFLASFRNSSMKFNGASLSCSEFNIGAARRAPLDPEGNWNLISGIRLASISTPQFTPQVDETFVLSKVTRTMVLPSLGISYQLSDAAAVYTAIGYAFGLSLSHTAPGDTNGKAGTSLSFTSGIRGTLYEAWGFELETTYLRDSYSYINGAQSVSTEFRGYKVHIATTYTF